MPVVNYHTILLHIQRNSSMPLLYVRTLESDVGFNIERMGTHLRTCIRIPKVDLPGVRRGNNNWVYKDQMGGCRVACFDGGRVGY